MLCVECQERRRHFYRSVESEFIAPGLHSFFSIQLNQSESFDYYLLRDKLSTEFKTAVDGLNRINLKQESIKKEKSCIGG